MADFLRNISHSTATDEELAAAYRQSGDLELLASLYARYMDLVFGVCLKYLGERETARDAVMQVFEELVRKLKVHEVTAFRGWLHAVARNHCLMQLRSNKSHRTVELPPTLMQSEEFVHLNGSLQKEESLLLLEKCLEALASEQQHAVRLFYLEEKSYNEIAAATGQEWNRVRSLIQNGRRNLKNCMDKNS